MKIANKQTIQENLIENRKIKEKQEKKKKKKKTGSATSSLTHRTRTPTPSADRSRGLRREHPANSTEAPNLLNPSNPNQVIIRKFEQKIKKSKGKKTRENREEVTAGEK
jgi:hypothetical protein